MAGNNNNQEKSSTITRKSNLAHGTYHMADDPKFYEPARTNNFEFIVTGLDNIIRAYPDYNGVNPESGSQKLANNTAQEAIRLSVKSANIPSFSQSPITISRGNSQIKYAGMPEFNTGSITLTDYIGLEAREALMAWQQLSYNVMTEKVGLASDYKKTCYLQEFTPDYQLIRTWKLIGCWISDLDQGGFDNSSMDVRSISATIQYDRAILDRHDSAGLGD